MPAVANYSMFKVRDIIFLKTQKAQEQLGKITGGRKTAFGVL
jgi:hypothetical protein